MANVFDQFDTQPAPEQGGGNVFDQFDAPQQRAPQQQAQEQPFFGRDNIAVQGASGFNEGLATALGAPVDIVNQVPRLLNLLPGVEGVGPISERPFLGSEQIEGALEAAGTIAPEGGGTGGRIARRVGEELGVSVPATVIPLAATAGKVARVGATTPSIAGDLANVARTQPGAFLASEVGSAAASGTGGAIAQEIDPDNPLLETGLQLTGAVLPTAAAGAVRRAVRGGRAGRQGVSRAIADFETAGATPSVGQATGSSPLQAVETGLGNVPGGAAPMRRAAEAAQTKMQKRLGALSSRVAGRTIDPAQAGAVVKRGIRGRGGFVDRFKETAGNLYTKLSDKIGGDTLVDVSGVATELDNLTAPITGAPEITKTLKAAGLEDIARAFRTDAGDAQQLPYAAVEQLRTRIGEKLATPDLVSDVSKGQLKRLYGALTDDMRRAALANGAGNEFNRANKFYNAGQKRIDTFLKGIVKKAEPEQIFKLLEKGGKEGATRIRAIRNSLKPEEWKVVRAAVIKRLGRTTAQFQDETGEVFSAARFMTDWSNFSPEAKAALFGTGTTRKDLDTIARAANRIKEGSRVLANPSGTTPLAVNVGTAAATGVAAVSGNMAALVPIVGGVVGANGAARLMTSPRFVRWLAKSTQIPVARLPGHISRLGAARFEDQEMMEAVAEYLSAIQQETQSAQ